MFEGFPGKGPIYAKGALTLTTRNQVPWLRRKAQVILTQIFGPDDEGAPALILVETNFLLKTVQVFFTVFAVATKACVFDQKIVVNFPVAHIGTYLKLKFVIDLVLVPVQIDQGLGPSCRLTFESEPLMVCSWDFPNPTC